jgi:hypothetical protein
MARLTALNITTSKVPLADKVFSEQIPNAIIGPAAVLPNNVSLETSAIQPPLPQSAAIWTPMTAFDDDLKAALVEWIDTTREGVKVAKNFSGRAKTMEFFFQGSATKSVRPAEIGYFKVTFKYPANINVPKSTNVATAGNTTASTA